MVTRTQLKELSKLRLQEAQHLLGVGLYDGACYLGGYAVELALKARICKLLKVAEYPERLTNFKIHKLEDLVYLAGLKEEWETKKNSSIQFLANSNAVFAWSETWRYLPKGTRSQANAQDFIEAITDTTDGVFTWIKNKW